MSYDVCKLATFQQFDNQINTNIKGRYCNLKIRLYWNWNKWKLSALKSYLYIFKPSCDAVMTTFAQTTFSYSLWVQVQVFEMAVFVFWSLHSMSYLTDVSHQLCIWQLLPGQVLKRLETMRVRCHCHWIPILA